MGGGSVSSQGAELGTSEDRPDLSPLPIVDLQKACTSVGGWAGEQGGHSLLGPWSFPGKLPPLTQGWPPVVQGRGSPCSKHPSCPSGKWFPALLLPQGRSGVSVCHRIQLEVYGRETTLPVASSPVPCPALLPSPLPPTSGPEFRETSPVSGSHLPFLLSREERPPPAPPPMLWCPAPSCLRDSRLWERSGGPGAKPTAEQPLRPRLISNVVCWMSGCVSYHLHLRGEPGEGEASSERDRETSAQDEGGWRY